MSRRTAHYPTVRLKALRLKSAGLVLPALLFAAACSDPTGAPLAPVTKPSFDVQNHVYTSGSNVRTWDAIPEYNQPDPFQPAYCTATPAVGLNANWQNEHNAFVLFGHPWANESFTAPWINAWSDLGSAGGNPVAPHYNWTKYRTQVSGNGSFVIRLLADNCSWIYLDGTLVGVQADDHTKLSYGVTLNGTHTLEFIIFDGGGAAGGKFILETTTNPPPPLNPDLDGDGHPNTGDAFPLDPKEWADTNGDGIGDNHDTDLDGAPDLADNCPAAPNADQADLDHDGVGNACDSDRDGDGVANETDAYPDDGTRTVFDADNDGILDGADNCVAVANADQGYIYHDGMGDVCDSYIEGDGYANDTDAFPSNPAESADSDHDGVGNNADVFPNDPAETVDTDHDGRGDNGDNCRVTPNANQADLDHDGIGDACDTDIDGDGVANGADVFPLNAAESADSDHDGIGNNADPFDNSNTGPTIMVGTCNTGAMNRHDGNGSWLNDFIASAYSTSRNHGDFVKAVANLTDSWKKAGWITGREEGAITSCAAKMK
jgi:hypothetical protein